MYGEGAKVPWVWGAHLQGHQCVQVSYTWYTIFDTRQYTHFISKPFLKERASDETKYAAAVIETFMLLGKMMAKSPESVHCQIATAVASFYSDKTEEQDTLLPEGTCVYSIHVHECTCTVHVPVRLYIQCIYSVHVHTPCTLAPPTHYYVYIQWYNNIIM